MIGAVVGVQPFGGEGLSGTGPKPVARTPVPASAPEQTVSINTTGCGGNAALLAGNAPRLGAMIDVSNRT